MYFYLRKWYENRLVKSKYDNRIWKVINEINHLYDHWVDKNYKLLAVGMEHYQGADSAIDGLFATTDGPSPTHTRSLKICDYKSDDEIKRKSSFN